MPRVPHFMRARHARRFFHAALHVSALHGLRLPSLLFARGGQHVFCGPTSCKLPRWLLRGLLFTSCVSRASAHAQAASLPRLSRVNSRWSASRAGPRVPHFTRPTACATASRRLFQRRSFAHLLLSRLPCPTRNASARRRCPLRRPVPLQSHPSAAVCEIAMKCPRARRA